MSMSARVLLGTAWGLCMFVPGLALVLDGPHLSWTNRSAPWSLLGIAAMAGGLFVFMTTVADRLMPLVGRRPATWRIEMALFLILCICGPSAFGMLISGGLTS
jgi:hypothetical protein